MKWLAILNPYAGRQSRCDLLRLARHLRHTLGAVCRFTAYPHHAKELVEKHPEYDGYIAVGGDGTVSEVVNGLSSDNHVIGIIPDGTSNDLARDLRLTPADAVHALAEPHCRAVDVVAVRFQRHGQWHERKMISTSALGYIAGVVEVAYRFKPWLGVFSHVVGAVWQPFRQRPLAARIRFDDEPWRELPLTTLVVQNTQNLGTFRLMPEARLDDGQFNVLWGRLSGFAQLWEDLGILLRRDRFRRSQHRRARRFDVEFPAGETLMVDGDLYDDVVAVHYEIEPARLSIATPQSPERGENVP